MKAWMPYLIVFSMLIAASFLRVGLHVIYSGRLKVKLLIGKLKFSIKKKERPADEIAVAPKTKKRKNSKHDLKPWLNAVMENWFDIFVLVGRIFTSPTLDVLRLQVMVGGKEPDQCALNYGRICSLVGTMLAPIENTFQIKKRYVDVRCCFDETDLSIDAEAAITLRVYEIIVLAVVALKLGLGLYRQAKSNMKVV